MASNACADPSPLRLVTDRDDPERLARHIEAISREVAEEAYARGVRHGREIERALVARELDALRSQLAEERAA